MSWGRFRPHILIAILALMALSFFAGARIHSREYPRTSLLAGASGAAAEVSGVEDVSLQPVELFQEIMTLLRRNYVSGISAKQETELGYAAVRGMLTDLNDPYTRFMDPEEFRGFREESQGHFEGIGATLEMMEVPDSPAPKAKPEGRPDTAALSPFYCSVCGADTGNPVSYHILRSSAKGFEAEYVPGPPTYRHFRITIVTPISGGPAEHIGIKPADQIVKIDDTSTYGMNLSEAVKRIKGPAGTTVTLLIARKGSNKPLEFRIVRGRVNIPTVEQKVLEGGIGYLRINQFNETSAELTADALAKLRAQNIRGLILDLRNNPGGGLEACLQIASMFVSQGPIVYIQSKGGEPEARLAPKQAHGIDIPVVVLVNRGSASASEILAGALQDRGVAKLVGERTFGKGLVQTVLTLDDGSAVAITTAKYLTPKKHEVNDRGINPDKQVAQAEDGPVDFLSDKDVQARAAIELIKAEIAGGPLRQATAPLAPAPAH